MNIKHLLISQAKNFGNKPAIIFNEQKTSFQELKKYAFQIASYLKKYGVGPDTKVGIFLPNLPETIYTYLGIFSVGAVLVPFDFMLTNEEIINLVNHSNTEILIIHPKKGIDIDEIRKRCPELRKIITLKNLDEETPSLENILTTDCIPLPEEELSEDTLSSILYTSGSTGHPKGVMLTYKHFDYPVKCVKHFLTITPQDNILCPGIPFSHIGGLDYILLMLSIPMTCVLMERFRPYEFLKNIERHKITLFWIVPSMYIAILTLKEAKNIDLSSLRYAVVFGAPSSPFLLKKFHQLCPNASLINGWGMTETTAPTCVLPPGINKIESVGKFYPEIEAKIVDEEGNILGPNQKGELKVKGNAVMVGYYKEPKLTQEVLDNHKWLATGDIAYYDNEGLFYIAGRKKDMIKVGGEIVFSSEIEEKILLHPKIKEAAVIGVKDNLRGEIPKAFIVPKENMTVTDAEIKTFLKDHLAHFKMPRDFILLKELPKTGSGKIDKVKLKDIC